MIKIETIENGLTVILEPIAHFASVAYEIHLPGGILSECKNSDGQDCYHNSLVIPELTERGVLGYDSKEFSDAFDNLGARHGGMCAQDRFIFRGTCLSDVLTQSLKLTTLQILHPILSENEIPPIVELLKLDLQSLEDNPARFVSVELAKRFLTPPFNRQCYIDPKRLEDLNQENCKNLYKNYFLPYGSIISVAGNFNPDKIIDDIKNLFKDWKGSAPSEPTFNGINPSFRYHIHKDTAQLQVCLAYPSAKFNDPDYYVAKVCNEILSGGMFGRLFVEVREKRGLCYSVYSRHSGGRYSGNVLCYAGTTSERAHETLKVMLDTIKGLEGTITESELSRAKINLISSLIISDESASSRCGSNAYDYWLIKKIRSIADIKQQIEKVTSAQIEKYLQAYSPDNYSLVTLGTKEITL